MGARSETSSSTLLRARESRWLYFEKDNAPLHLGFVVHFDEPLGRDELIAHVAARIDRLPHSTQRASAPTFNAAAASWEPDPSFDLLNHIHATDLGKSATQSAMKKRAGEILSKVLDRRHPLWELHLLQGRTGTMMVVKVHRAILETPQRTGGKGISAAAWLQTLFDARPEATPARSTIEPEVPAEVPRRELGEVLVGRSLEAMEAWSLMSISALDVVHEWLSERTFTAWESLLTTMPDLAIPIRPLPFNRPGHGSTRIDWIEFSLAEARAVRRQLFGTIDDLALALVAGAVGRYTREHGQSVDRRTLRILMQVPLSPRASTTRPAMSAVPLNLPLDVEDPAERLRTVREITRLLKAARVADVVDRTSALLSIVPPTLQASAGSLYSGGGLPGFHLPMATSTGPQIPMYLAGRRATAIVPYIPTAYRLGATIAVYSYDQRLFLGLAGSSETCPDFSSLGEHIRAEFDTLKTRLGIADTPAIELRRRGGRGVEGRSQKVRG